MLDCLGGSKLILRILKSRRRRQSELEKDKRAGSGSERCHFGGLEDRVWGP